MDAINGVLESISKFYEILKSIVTMDQMMITSAALFVLIVALLIVLSSRTRHFKEALDEKTAENEPDSAFTEREKRLDQKEEMLLRREAELSKFKRPHEKLPPKGGFAGLSETPSALLDVETGKLMSETRKQAQELLSQAEREYLEVVSRAHDEAEFIRQKANERLLRAHESLRQSIARSGEIIEEAYIEARVASVRPSLIEAGKNEDERGRSVPFSPDASVPME